MDITPDFLRNEVAAMEAKKDQLVADLNLTVGALQVLTQLLTLAESPGEPEAKSPEILED
jgi:hypothetical protein